MHAGRISLAMLGVVALAVTTAPPASAEPAKPGPNVVAWSFAGAAAITLATGVVFEIVGYGEYKDVEDSGCRPRCGRREDAGRVKMLVGDVLIGVGLVSTAAALYFFLTEP